MGDLSGVTLGQDMPVVIKVVQRWVDRFHDRYQRVIAYLRDRSPLFDHFWLAKERYGDVLGGRLSAAIAYYGFFAVFALTAVVYTIVIDVFSGSANMVADVDSFLARYFTTLNIEALKDNVGNIRAVGLISLVLAGVGWVDAWRSSLRAIWGLDQHPGNFLLLRLVDLGTLIVFGLMMGISLGVTDGLERLFQLIADGADKTVWFRTGVLTLTFVINMVIAFGLMTILPRMHLTIRRLLPSIVAIAIGLTVLNWAGRALVLRTEHNPAYAVVASSVGLLVYLYLFNQIVLWAAAWAATAQNGRVFDLAWGKPREHDTLTGSELSGQ